jgi:hypothetical protein
MSVVINEFEVVDTAPAARGTDHAAPSPAPTAAPLEPEDLRQLLAINAELQLRRFAH